MKIVKLNFIAIFLIFTFIAVSYSVESMKPENHDASWIKLHGQSSKANIDECIMCHTERDACIRCHQDTPPRNHTPSWNRRGHGLESKWNRDKCMTCHSNDFCQDCHTSTAPVYHNRPFLSGGHCYADCHSPALTDTKCITCHKSYHGPEGP